MELSAAMNCLATWKSTVITTACTDSQWWTWPGSVLRSKVFRRIAECGVLYHRALLQLPNAAKSVHILSFDRFEDAFRTADKPWHLERVAMPASCSLHDLVDDPYSCNIYLSHPLQSSFSLKSTPKNCTFAESVLMYCKKDKEREVIYIWDRHC